MLTQRIATVTGFLDLVDLLGRGGTEDWCILYDRARRDAALRDEIRAAIPLVDPEMGAARELWIFLLEHLERRIDPETAPPQPLRGALSL